MFRERMYEDREFREALVRPIPDYPLQDLVVFTGARHWKTGTRRAKGSLTRYEGAVRPHGKGPGHDPLRHGVAVGQDETLAGTDLNGQDGSVRPDVVDNQDRDPDKEKRPRRKT